MWDCIRRQPLYSSARGLASNYWLLFSRPQRVLGFGSGSLKGLSPELLSWPSCDRLQGGAFEVNVEFQLRTLEADVPGKITGKWAYR